MAVSTGTSSGKSLCYQIPVAEAALAGHTSLMIFPTKALAQDQLLLLLLGGPGPGRRHLRRRLHTRGADSGFADNANVLLTNPEMLHQGILPNHGRWAPFLHRLRFVVVDELHVLRGIFGSHTSQVLRRLRRLVRHYGGQDPTFIFTSATIGRSGRSGRAALRGPGRGRHRRRVTVGTGS